MSDVVVLATRNAHKVGEVSRMLEAFGIEVKPLPATVVLPPEDGETFAANALGKARAAAQQLGVPVIADDSGIESAALGGRPGVRSARFAGESAGDAENLAKLVAEAPAGTGLRYVCVLAYVAPGGGQRATTGHEQLFFGECHGIVADRPRGSGGFGYDPAFVPDEGPSGLTMAELAAADKDELSHRGRAVRSFARWLTEQR